MEKNEYKAIVVAIAVTLAVFAFAWFSPSPTIVYDSEYSSSVATNVIDDGPLGLALVISAIITIVVIIFITRGGEGNGKTS